MPVQNDAMWRRLYELAARIRELAPWEQFEETDVFGVQHPATGVTDYVSIMGSMGTHLAIAVYLGADGWFGFWRAQESGEHPESRPEEILEVPHFQLAYGDRDELLPQEKAVLKRLNLQFRGPHAWPMFRSYEPGLYPWPLDAESQARILPALLQTIEVLPTLDDRLGNCLQGKDAPCLIRIPDTDGHTWKDEWRVVAPPTPRTWRSLVPEDLLQAVERMTATDRVFELDAFMSFEACQQQENERPYWPYIVTMMDAKTRFAFKPEVLSPVPSFDGMWAQLPALVCTRIRESGVRPGTIRVRSPRIKDLLLPTAKRLGIKVRMVKRLPAVEALRNSFLRQRDMAGP